MIIYLRDWVIGYNSPIIFLHEILKKIPILSSGINDIDDPCGEFLIKLPNVEKFGLIVDGKLASVK